MTATFTPERWAFDITKMLNLVLGPEHFPIDVVRLAREYTAQRFPGDPITLAEGANLSGFDGALIQRARAQQRLGYRLQQCHHLARQDQLHAGPRICALPFAPRGPPERHSLRRTGCRTVGLGLRADGAPSQPVRGQSPNAAR